jgi:hypothetical protein
MDEVDLDEFLKEAADAIEDADKLSEFIREKTIIAIERFLVSLVFVCSGCACATYTNAMTWPALGLPTEDVDSSGKARSRRRMDADLSWS